MAPHCRLTSTSPCYLTHTLTQHHRPLCAAHRDRPLVGEEAAQDHHLADTDQQDDDRLTDGPVVDPPVEVLGEDAALRLTQTVVGLVVEDYLELVVDELRRRLHLQRDKSWCGIALYSPHSQMLQNKAATA